MQKTSQLNQLIEINKLEKSTLNVRKSGTPIEDIKASIIAHGLLQNLVVIPGKAEGSFKVIAGGRRLEAIQQLIKEKKIDLTAVPCKVVSEEEALEMSLAENTMRSAMHPADEFEAYQALSKQGIAAGKIAERFGMTEKHVLQRLALNQVAPEIIKDYKAGKITLESVMAFTIAKDQGQQMKVYKTLDKHDKTNTHIIKRALQKDLPAAKDRAVQYVGLETYKKAGGKLREDLFGDNVYIENPPLLIKLMLEKFEAAKVKLLKAGWLWAEIVQEEDYNYRNKMQRLYPDAKGKYKAEDMKIAGCYGYIDYNGKLDFTEGLVRPAEKKLIKKNKPAGKINEPKKEMSDTLRWDMQNARLQSMQVILVKNPLIAADLATYRLALNASKKSYACDGISIDLPDTSNKDFHPEYNLITKGLKLEWMKLKTDVERFQAFEKLNGAEKSDIFAWAVARALPASLFNHKGDYDSTEYAIAQTGVDIATLWRPTAENYFMKITRDQLLEIVAEIHGKKWAEQNKNEKKSVIAASLDGVFNRPDAYKKITNEAVMEKVKKWLPKGMALAPIQKPAKGK